MGTYIGIGLASLLALCGLVIWLTADSAKDRIFSAGAVAGAAATLCMVWFFSDTRNIAKDLRDAYGPEMYCARCQGHHPVGKITASEMEESEYTGCNWTAKIYPKPTEKCRDGEPMSVKFEYEWPCVIATARDNSEELSGSREAAISNEKCPAGITEADSNRFAKAAHEYKLLADMLDAELESKWNAGEAELLPLISGDRLPDTNAVARIAKAMEDAQHMEVSRGCEAMLAMSNCPTWFITRETSPGSTDTLRIHLERIRQLSDLRNAIQPRVTEERAKVHYARYRAGVAYIRAVRDGADEATAKKRAKEFLEGLK